MKLYLIRHGQTESNFSGTFTGQCDVELTDEGRNQAQRLQPILSEISFDRVYSSDLSRAIETQRLALPGVEGVRTPLLREIHVGSIECVPYSIPKKGIPDWAQMIRTEGYARFGGESVQDVEKRVKKFLDMQLENPCENVVAFVHNGIMGITMNLVLGANIDRGALRTSNCAINVFEHDGKQWRLLAWNYKGNV